MTSSVSISSSTLTSSSINPYATQGLYSTCSAPAHVALLVNMTQPYCGIPIQSYENASIAMRTCCNGADFIIPEEECAVYCKVVGQTAQQLTQCLNNMGDVLNNRAEVVCSSDATATSRLQGIFKRIFAMGVLVVILAS